MLIEFLDFNDWSSYILFASLLVSLTTTFGLLYFIQFYVNDRASFQTNWHSSAASNMQAQRYHNENNCIGNWLAICVRRKESPDDSPAHSLLENEPASSIQGGSLWKKNQNTLYLLLSEGYIY